jgi:hypothetical protein
MTLTIMTPVIKECREATHLCRMAWGVSPHPSPLSGWGRSSTTAMRSKRGNVKPPLINKEILVKDH